MSSSVAQTLENVLYEKKGAIAYVTVNRPKVLNALNHRTWEDLRTAFEEARDDARGARRNSDRGRAIRPSSRARTSANSLMSPRSTQNDPAALGKRS